MRPAIIRKAPGDMHAATEAGVGHRSFSWQRIGDELAGTQGGNFNIATLAVDRHAAGANPSKVALRWLPREGAARDFTYTDLKHASDRFASSLSALGVAKGDGLFVLAGRIPELYIGVLGGLKAGMTVTPLFSAFGPEPIRTRVELGRGKILLTTESLYRRKIEKIRAQMPTLEQVIIVGDTVESSPIAGTLDYARLMAGAAPGFKTVATTAEDRSFLHFTSGTTGTPKGAIHVHGAALMHYASARFALDLKPDDIFWCTADPGWVTGTSYGIVAPLLHGVTSIVDEADFDAERWYRILEEQAVSVWYTAPTAIRMLMKAGTALPAQHRFARLRFIASVGEPLNPEAVWWGQEVLGLPIHDNWWQTETGGIMIANTAAMDIKPGSMGKPLPGIEAMIVTRDADGRVRIDDAPDRQGELALRSGWPGMFRGYLDQEERYRKCFVADPAGDRAGDLAGAIYLSGDLARRDADGYFWFIGRADDVIKSAGHLIGPFEVESMLLEHPAVAEAGVIGKPDPVVGEVVKAFVSLKAGFEASEALRSELLGHARKRLGAAVAPKEIAFLASLPRTRSGKIMRRLLKARELGLPEGDLSTLEGSS